MIKRCYLVDDDIQSIERMEILIKQLSNFRIVGKETNPKKAISFISSLRPDIIFLDIEMPGLSGIDLVEKIIKNDFKPVIIFVTGFDKYAIQAIKKSAFDYLLKPVSFKELKNTLNRLINNIDKSNIQEINNLISKLTKREIEIYNLLKEGKTSKEISQILNISVETSNTHRRRIINKLGLKSTKEILLLK